MCRTLLECKFVSSIIMILLLIMGFFTFILCNKCSFNLDFELCSYSEDFKHRGFQLHFDFIK